MVLGVLSDVHGNLPALEAVLADLGTVDALLCLGDFVGYYPDTAAVVDRLRGLGVLAIRGNHELMLSGARPVPPERAGYYRIAEARADLSAGQLAWLEALPSSLALQRGGISITARHASPWDEETYLYPDTDLDRLDLADGALLLLGHTHHPMWRAAGRGVVANPGSVGQPRDWDPRAAYAVVDLGTGRFEQRRVAYDHRALQRRLEGLGLEPRAIALLGRERAPAEAKAGRVAR